MNSLSNQFERKAWKIQDRLQPEMEQRSLSHSLSLHPFLLLHPCNYLAAEAAAANEQAFWLWNFHLFTSIRRVEEKNVYQKCRNRSNFMPTKFLFVQQQQRAMNALLIAYSILHLCICILIECVCVCVSCMLLGEWLSWSTIPKIHPTELKKLNGIDI